MIWEFPTLPEYWKGVRSVIRQTTDRDIGHSPWECVLGMIPRPGTSKVTSRFIDLALIVAKLQITRQWKCRTGPKWGAWTKELLKWARAEGIALHRTMNRGLT